MVQVLPQYGPSRAGRAQPNFCCSDNHIDNLKLAAVGCLKAQLLLSQSRSTSVQETLGHGKPVGDHVTRGMPARVVVQVTQITLNVFKPSEIDRIGGR
jgi:hypothetical protein